MYALWHVSFSPSILLSWSCFFILQPAGSFGTLGDPYRVNNDVVNVGSSTGNIADQHSQVVAGYQTGTTNMASSNPPSHPPPLPSSQQQAGTNPPNSVGTNSICIPHQHGDPLPDQQQQTLSSSTPNNAPVSYGNGTSSMPSSQGPGTMGGATSTGEFKSTPQGQPKRLHVSNIPFRFREPDLRQLFYVS